MSGDLEPVVDIDWHRVMACVLPQTAERLRELAELTGRSTQDIAGLAIDHALGLGGLSTYLLEGVLDGLELMGGVVSDQDEATPDGVRIALARNALRLRLRGVVHEVAR